VGPTEYTTDWWKKLKGDVNLPASNTELQQEEVKEFLRSCRAQQLQVWKVTGNAPY
jgi:hypothetical protein